MRKVIYGAACSADGFIAAPDGSLDWLHFSSDVQAIMAATFRGVDAVLMGANTWRAGLEQGGGDWAPPVAGLETYVFSRSLPAIETPAVTLVPGDAVEFVRGLRHKTGGDICLMGGGLLARSLMAANLVDEVGLNIHPVLLGGGPALFHDVGRRVPLALVESKVLDGGCVLATYRVTDVDTAEGGDPVGTGRAKAARDAFREPHWRTLA